MERLHFTILFYYKFPILLAHHWYTISMMWVDRVKNIIIINFSTFTVSIFRYRQRSWYRHATVLVTPERFITREIFTTIVARMPLPSHLDEMLPLHRSRYKWSHFVVTTSIYSNVDILKYGYSQMWMCLYPNVDIDIPKCGYDYTQMWINVDIVFTFFHFWILHSKISLCTDFQLNWILICILRGGAGCGRSFVF